MNWKGLSWILPWSIEELGIISDLTEILTEHLSTARAEVLLPDQSTRWSWRR
jgi:hypothetical protein